MKDALQRLGYEPKPDHKRRLREACARYDLPWPALRTNRPEKKPRPSKIRNEAALREALSQHSSFAAVLGALGCASSSKNYRALERACIEFGLQPPIRAKNGRGKPTSERFGDRAAFAAAAAASSTRKEMLAALGKPGAYDWLLEAAKHHRVEPPNRSYAARGKPRARPLVDILVEHSTYTDGQRLRMRLVEEGLLDDVCRECGLGPEWNGRPLVLQLDHINGIPNDNRLDNLRLLCPNCHTQTETFTGRKNRRRPAA